ncbi:hypothetical protein [Candidatus Fokinia solitaria]|nr:hypothetical protein [Candidatus Fokinia solitaria]
MEKHDTPHHILKTAKKYHEAMSAMCEHIKNFVNKCGTNGAQEHCATAPYHHFVNIVQEMLQNAHTNATTIAGLHSESAEHVLKKWKEELEKLQQYYCKFNSKQCHGE